MQTAFGLLAMYILFLGLAEFFRKVRSVLRMLFRRSGV